MKKVALVIISTCIASISFAQDWHDAIRYSESFPMGNARFTAMSGAFGAIGANTSAISVNPAGSALFKKDVFEFTPSYMMTKTQNYYLGGYNANYTMGLSIPNLGIVFTKDVQNSDFFVSGISFGFTVNRQNFYDSEASFSAKNNNSSLTDEMLRLVNGGYNSKGYTQLAINTQLLYDFDDTGVFESDFRKIKNGDNSTQYGQLQDVSIIKSGKSKEYLFNFGVDFSEAVYIGGAVDFEKITYSESYEFSESDVDGTFDELSNYRYSTDLEATGNGIGANIGIIVKPSDFIRFGYSAHSPQKIIMNEDYISSIDANYDILIDGENNNLYSDFEGNFNYKYWQPGKTVASLAFVYKNLAIVSVDYETIYHDYAQFSSSDYNFNAENQGIKTNLDKASNIRAGAELRYGPFSFRGGFALYENPIKNFTPEGKYYRTDLSGGIGLSNDDFYVDLSLVKSKTEGEYTFYNDFNNTPVKAKSDKYNDNIFLTFGFKF